MFRRPLLVRMQPLPAAREERGVEFGLSIAVCIGSREVLRPEASSVDAPTDYIEKMDQNENPPGGLPAGTAGGYKQLASSY